jgi:hypothetical protein
VDWLRDIVGRFRRDLPLLIVGWVVATLLIIGLAFVAGEPLDFSAFALWMLVAFVGFVPLRWMRFENPLVRPSHDRFLRTLGALGLGCLWAVLCGGGALVLLAILGPD